MTRFGLVIGDPVEHSLSPAMHNAAFEACGIDAEYRAQRVAPDQLKRVVASWRESRPIGVSVTLPHKQAIVQFVDRIEAPADWIGAVNCVVIEEDGTLVGHNTDAPGFVDGTGEVAGVRAVLLGGGGAARAVATGLEDAGATVTVVARTPANAPWTAARPWSSETLAELVPSCGLLVDCTSMGLDASTEDEVPAPIPIDALPDGALVATLVYHRETSLLARAKARGLRTLDGGPMLVYQGARAFRLWTGVEPPVDVMFRSIGTTR